MFWVYHAPPGLLVATSVVEVMPNGWIRRCAARTERDPDCYALNLVRWMRNNLHAIFNYPLMMLDHLS